MQSLQTLAELARYPITVLRRCPARPEQGASAPCNYVRGLVSNLEHHMHRAVGVYAEEPAASSVIGASEFTNRQTADRYFVARRQQHAPFR